MLLSYISGEEQEWKIKKVSKGCKVLEYHDFYASASLKIGF
jgi:hypothetical protein